MEIEEREERIEADLQEHFELILDELGNPRDWSQDDANHFYERFFDGIIIDKQVILKVIDIKEYPNFHLLIANVLDPINFQPFFNPYLRKNWTVAFTLPQNTDPFNIYHVVLANAEKLELSSISNENRKLDLIAINVSSILFADLETSFKGNFGKVIIQSLIHKFGSLESVAPFIINQLESSIEDEVNRLAQYLEEQDLKLEAEHNKTKNEKIESFKEIETKLEQEHKEMKNSYDLEKAELDRKKKKLVEIREKLDVEETSLKSKESELRAVKESLEARAKEIDIYESRLRKQLQRFQLLNPLEDSIEEETETQEVIKWNEQDDIISTIRGALHAQCDLQYTRSVIEGFVGALKTDQLIILHGPSGTGKSSLVSNFSKIIKGAKTCTIRVQSSWTDKQDLLGFFNPLDFQYISTPFLDTLIEANQNKEKLYLVCLDEMNLAHVEYYFAEFLSAREEKEQKISLYSKHFQRLAMSLIQPYLIGNEFGLSLLNEEELTKLTATERIRLQNCFDLCNKYPAEFTIPKNVRFIGTMNMDHTVKGLSPKMVDRSFVINIEYPENESALLAELEQLKVKELIELDVAADLSVSEMNYELREEFRQLNELLDVLGARLNRRSLDQIGYFSAAVGSDLMFEQIVLGKILPRINILKDEEKLQVFNELTSTLPISEDTRKIMRRMDGQGRIITYWR